jgi:outer membrane protein insertion porin family
VNNRQAEGTWRSFEYNFQWRDLIPRRFASSPYACDASADIVCQAGSNLKHSLSYDYRMNHINCNDPLNPTEGYDCSYNVELAGPPGDVGFFKWQGASSLHIPLSRRTGAALHWFSQAGFVKSLEFGGLCHDRTYISDRFFVGGPLQLRGFQPPGIGPRAETVRVVCSVLFWI